MHKGEGKEEGRNEARTRESGGRCEGDHPGSSKPGSVRMVRGTLAMLETCGRAPTRALRMPRCLRPTAPGLGVLGPRLNRLGPDRHRVETLVMHLGVICV